MKQFFETTSFLREKGIQDPEIGIILGTGLGSFINEITAEVTLDYDEIPNFPISTVESHHGKLIYGSMHGKKILAMQGRFHFYEGYSLREVTFPIRIMKLMGVKYLLISNACGAMNLDFKKGTLMLIDDHINLIPDNPLIGKNYDELGPRYPDMSAPYSKFLNERLLHLAKENDITLHSGVYAAVSGPSLETRAEYRYLKTIGADAVGMSTVPEVIVAKHMGLPCAAISVITDECDPENLKPFDIKDIVKAAVKAEKKLIVLFSELIRGL